MTASVQGERFVAEMGVIRPFLRHSRKRLLSSAGCGQRIHCPYWNGTLPRRWRRWRRRIVPVGAGRFAPLGCGGPAGWSCPGRGWFRWWPQGLAGVQMVGAVIAGRWRDGGGGRGGRVALLRGFLTVLPVAVAVGNVAVGQGILVPFGLALAAYGGAQLHLFKIGPAVADVLMSGMGGCGGCCVGQFGGGTAAGYRQFRQRAIRATPPDAPASSWENGAGTPMEAGRFFTPSRVSPPV